jgi:hypothetical protein
MIGPEVSVCSFEHASCHPQKTASHQHVGPGLREPRSRHGPQDVGRHVITNASSLRNVPYGPANAERGMVAPLDNATPATVTPAAQVWEQSIGAGGFRLFVFFARRGRLSWWPRSYIAHISIASRIVAAQSAHMIALLFSIARSPTSDMTNSIKVEAFG